MGSKSTMGKEREKAGTDLLVLVALENYQWFLMIELSHKKLIWNHSKQNLEQIVRV